MPTIALPAYATTTREFLMERKTPRSVVFDDQNPGPCRRVKSSETAVCKAARAGASASIAEENATFIDLAGQLIAGEFQTVKVSQCRHSDGFGLEKLVRQTGKILCCHSLDPLDQFIEIVESIEIHLLARQI